jgi:hypothetical protein
MGIMMPKQVLDKFLEYLSVGRGYFYPLGIHCLDFTPEANQITD